MGWSVMCVLCGVCVCALECELSVLKWWSGLLPNK